MEQIPVCEPYLLGNELKYVTEAVTSNWISSQGKFVTELETRFAEYIGCRFATTTSNGTTALHLACLALGIGPGDEVLVPDFTMIASAFAVCYTGAKPVFVDAEKITWNIDPNLIEQKITSRTKAIMITHIYGHPCDMDPIMAIARKHNLPVIEDAAEVHGAFYHGQKCGNIGHISCFSFFSNKIITCGEGGMVTTNDPELYDRCRYFKNLCFPLNGPRNYIHQDIGYNFRMPNTLAAIACGQLERIEDLVAMRRRNQNYYRDQLANIPGITFQIESPGTRNVYWMIGVLLDRRFPIHRDQLAAELKEHKIETRNFFYPMHKQPALIKFGCQEDPRNFPVSTYLSENGLYIPSSSHQPQQQMDYVCEVIRKIAKS